MKLNLFGYQFELRSHPSNPSNDFLSLFNAGTSSGVSVTTNNAMTVSAFYRAVSLVSSTVASTPAITYRRTDDGKERAVRHPVTKLLKQSPNPLMSSFSFTEAMVGHIYLWGNAYAEIVRNGTGRPQELWLIQPSRVRIDIVSHRLVYIVSLPRGGEAKIPAENMLHVMGFSNDGIVGRSCLTEAREAMGLSLATEKHGNKFFGNSARPSGALTYPGKLTDKAFKRLKGEWAAAHEGLDNSSRTAILEDGIGWKQVGMSSEDAQFLQTRQFQIAEVARFTGVPPHLLYDLTKSSFNNIEAQSQEFVTYSLLSWYSRLEAEYNRKLFLPGEQEHFFVEHLLDNLLRADVKSRHDTYAKGRQWGYLSVNDIRRAENMNPLGPEGDIYLQPANMVDANAEPDPEPEPKKEPEPEPEKDTDQIKDAVRKELKSLGIVPRRKAKPDKKEETE